MTLFDLFFLYHFFNTINLAHKGNVSLVKVKKVTH